MIIIFKTEGELDYFYIKCLPLNRKRVSRNIFSVYTVWDDDGRPENSSTTLKTDQTNPLPCVPCVTRIISNLSNFNQPIKGSYSPIITKIFYFFHQPVTQSAVNNQYNISITTVEYRLEINCIIFHVKWIFIINCFANVVKGFKIQAVRSNIINLIEMD